MYYSNRHIYIIVCIAVLFATTGIRAQNIDSLRHQIDIQTGKDKHISLAVYHNHILANSTPEGISYLRNQLAVSEKKGDLETQGKILQLFMINHYYSQNGDSVLYYTEKIKLLNTRHSLYFYFSVMNTSISMLTADGRYERALQELDGMLAEATKRNDILAKAQAYQLMATLYNYKYQPELAAKYITEGLQLIEPIKSAELNIHVLRFNLYNCGANTAFLSEDNNKGLIYADSMYSEVKQLEKYYIQNNLFSEAELAHYYYNTYIQYLSFLTGLGRFTEAESMLNELTVIAKSPAIPQAYNIVVYNYTKAQYLAAIKDYDSALKLLDDAMEIARTHLFSQYALSLLLKANILEKQNKIQPALDIYKEFHHIQDSLKNSELQKQITDLKSVYQVKELEQQAEDRETRMRIAYSYITFISLVCILLVIIVFISRKNSNQQKEKNRVLYIQLKEQDKYKNALKIITSENLPDAAESNELFDRINNYVVSNKYYLEPNISRENLALIMGTNYKYLTDAVREATGKTFGDYITDLRLEYARDQLMSNPNERIQVIYNTSGFNNKTTFNRLFTRKFGLTPTDFRKMVGEMRNESAEI